MIMMVMLMMKDVKKIYTSNKSKFVILSKFHSINFTLAVELNCNSLFQRIKLPYTFANVTT